METISLINRGWKLCTCASFIGCIILFVILDHSQDGSNLVLTLQNMPKSSTILPNGSNISKQVIHLSNIVNNNNNSKQNIKEDNKCNMFDGKWIYNPKASSVYTAVECPFLSDQVSCQRNGRPDFDYEKWTWESNGCHIPRYNGKDMLERLRGKRVIIVGDSLNRNQWESLACLLYTALPPSQTCVNVRSGVYKVLRAKEYNCTVEFFWSPFLVELEMKKENGNRILRLDKLSDSYRQWLGADVMVFNTGHWWPHRGKLKAWDLTEYKGKLEEMRTETALEIAMNTWASWIDQNVDMAKTSVFFRSISPEHKGKLWCYNITKPITDYESVVTFSMPLIQTVERTIQGMKTPVKYLNVTKLSQYRRDAHPSVYTAKKGKKLTAVQRRQPQIYADCSHWCLPGIPDAWNRLLFASFVFDTSRDLSTS